MIHSEQHKNVFVLSTEYQIMLALSVIEEFFSDGNFYNQLVLCGHRGGGLNIEALPRFVSAVRLGFSNHDFVKRVEIEVFDRPIKNLFTAHAYRPFETYILSKVKKGTEIHQLQDGALFYHRQEIALWKSRIKESFNIYKNLFKRGVILKDFVWFGRHMHRSGYIKKLWMTHPDLFIDKECGKPIQKINLFPTASSIETAKKCFSSNDHIDFTNLKNCLIYLAPIILKEELFAGEIAEIAKIMSVLGKENIVVKIHPGYPQPQRKKLIEDAFGPVVVQNYVPAELYIANAIDSCVVSTASTALFYEQTHCPRFALKHYYQRIGLYAKWKNVNLPKAVKLIDEIEDFTK